MMKKLTAVVFALMLAEVVVMYLTWLTAFFSGNYQVLVRINTIGEAYIEGMFFITLITLGCVSLIREVKT